MESLKHSIRTFFLTLFIMPFVSSSQVMNQLDSLKKQGCFSLQISPFLTSKVNFDHLGVDLVQSKHLLSAELGLSYFVNLKKSIYLQSTLNIGLMPYNLNFKFNAPQNSIYQTGPYKDEYRILDFNWSEYSYIRSYSSIDAILYKKINIPSQKKENTVLIGSGLRTSFFAVDDFYFDYISSYYIDENNPYIELFHAQIDDSVRNNLKISLLIDCSVLFTLQNKHLIKTSLFLNYSPFDNIKGRYVFNELGFSSFGNFNQRLSYFGFRINYFFKDNKKSKV